MEFGSHARPSPRNLSQSKKGGRWNCASKREMMLASGSTSKQIKQASKRPLRVRRSYTETRLENGQAQNLPSSLPLSTHFVPVPQARVKVQLRAQ